MHRNRMQGAYFYRIIDQFIDQTGVETESVFGGQVRRGALVSMVYARCTTGAANGAAGGSASALVGFAVLGGL